MHVDCAVEWNVETKGSVANKGEQIATHGQENNGKAEHLDVGGTSGDAHAVATDATQTGLFPLSGVVCLQDKETDR